MFDDLDPSSSGEWGGGHTLNVDPPTGFMTTRERIMADPGMRLSFNIEQLKAKQQAESIDVKRHTDQVVMPLILDDAKKNQDHMDHLNESIVEFTKKMDHPYPIREAAQLGTGDTLGIGLAALFGGKVSDVAGAAYKNNQGRSDLDYENRVNQYGSTKSENEQVLARLQREMQEAQAHGDRLEETRIGEAGHEVDVQRAGLEKARDRFARATNPGEVQQAADDLKNLGETVSDQAIADSKTSAGLKEHKQGMADAETLHRGILAELTLMGGSSPERVKILDEQIKDINAKYGTNYPPVPGGPTEKSLHDAATDKERKQSRKDAMARFDAHEKGLNARFSQSEKDKVANWSEERAIGRLNANSNQVRAANSGAISHSHTQITYLTGQLAATQKALQSKKDASGRALAKEEIKRLHAAQANLTSRIAGWKAVLADQERDQQQDFRDMPDKSDASTSAAAPTSAAASTSEVGTTKNGTKWRAH